MHTTTALIVGCVAALAFAAPKPALATTATTAVPAIHNGDAGMVQEVGKKDKNWTKRDRYTYRDAPRYRPYGYSYRRYSYDDDYDYYDYPRRRSGVNLHLDF